MTSTTLSVATLLFLAAAQLNNQTPSDYRSNQFEDPKGASWRVFAVDSHAGGPMAITQVEEIRQHNPPSTWAVYARNRSVATVPSAALAAAIVAGDGTLKAIQPMPGMRNVKPNQAVRQEIRVTVTVLLPTDRVVFFVNDVSGDAVAWKADKTAVGALIKSAAIRMPVP